MSPDPSSVRAFGAPRMFSTMRTPRKMHATPLFHTLLGFDNVLIQATMVSPNFPNISNNIDNLYICCSLLSDSIVSGAASNVLHTFPTNTKTRSLPFEIRPYNYLPQPINTKRIDNVRFYITDDNGRILDLNDIDISITVVIGIM